MDATRETGTTQTLETTTTYPIVHVEFSANDPAESAKFYHELFGWKTEHMGDWDYWTFQNEADRGGGFNPIGTGSSGLETKPGDVIVYVSTPDLDGTVARALDLGATLVVPRVDMPGMGSFSVVQDPTGNKVGLWMSAQPAQK